MAPGDFMFVNVRPPLLAIGFGVSASLEDTTANDDALGSKP